MLGCEAKEEREKQIKAEVKRLSAQFRDIEAKKKKITSGLVERAAFMRISLKDLEEDLNTFGFWELFSQGDQEPYQRKRPAAEIYNQTNKNYQSIIKQLTDLLPKEDTKQKTEGDDFDDFVNLRDG